MMVLLLRRGKFLAETASDDVWMKDKLSKQLAVLESDEDLVVFTEAEIIDESGQRVCPTWTEFHGISAKKTGDIFHDLLGRWEFFMNSNMLLKRANLGHIRFDESLKYGNDYKMYLELAAKYRVLFHTRTTSSVSNTFGTTPVAFGGSKVGQLGFIARRILWF